LTADGKVLAVAAGENVRLFAAADGKERHTLKLTGMPSALAFAPGGGTLAVGMFDSTVRLFDPAAGKEERALEGHSGAVLGLAFSRDGRTLATAGYDRKVIAWEAASGRPIRTWEGHAGPATAVAVAPDGRAVASGGADTTALVWDLTGRGPKLGEVKLTRAEVDRLWQELAAAEPAKAHAGLWTLVAGAADAAPMLKGRVLTGDPKRLDKLIADLDSDRFADREAAVKELKTYGRWIEGALEKALTTTTSSEAKARLNHLLGEMKRQESITLEQERLRIRRLIQVLEQSGTAPAREGLNDLAVGAAEADLREDARSALARLGAGGSAP
jgi:hypothetical protein